MNFLFRTLSRITLTTGRNGGEREREREQTNCETELSPLCILIFPRRPQSRLGGHLRSVRSVGKYICTDPTRPYQILPDPSSPYQTQPDPGKPKPRHIQAIIGPGSSELCLGYKICMWKHGNVPPWQPSASFSMLSNVVEPHNYFCLKFGSPRPERTTRSELPQSQRRLGGLKCTN